MLTKYLVTNKATKQSVTLTLLQDCLQIKDGSVRLQDLRQLFELDAASFYQLQKMLGFESAQDLTKLAISGQLTAKQLEFNYDLK